jgi:hypothetical protein
MLLDACGSAWLESKRNDSAITAALRSYIGKTAAANCVGAWHIGGRNFDVETIAATISLIVVQGLI